MSTAPGTMTTWWDVDMTGVRGDGRNCSEAVESIRETFFLKIANGVRPAGAGSEFRDEWLFY